MHLNILITLGLLIFCCHQQKIKKWASFDILMTVIPRVNMKTRQIIPFFSFSLWGLPVDIIYFCISRSRKLNSLGSPLCIMLCSLKYIFIHVKDDTFKPVNIDNLVTHKICKLLVYIWRSSPLYITCFVPNLIPVWLQFPML